MATIPGTKFAEGAPSGRTGQVTMQAPREGGQEIASAMGQLGGVLFNYALEVEKKKMNAEYSRLQREFDEAGWAARESITGDEEADAKVWQEFEKKASELTQSSKYEDVNSLLQEHINKHIPTWKHAYWTHSLSMQARNATDQVLFEGNKKLELGDTEGYKKDINNLYRLKSISKEKRDHLIETAPAQSQLLRAERLIELKNYDAAISELEKLNNKDLTTEQIHQKNVLLSSTKKLKDYASSELINDICGKIAQGMTLDKVEELIKQTVGISEVQRIELMKAAISADKIYNQEGINHWTQTDERGHEILTDLMVDIENGRVKTNEEIERVWLSGGAPNFDFNKMLWAKNLLAAYNTPTKGYSPSHDVSKKYFEKLESLYMDDEGKIEDRKGYIGKRFALEEILKTNWGNAHAIETQFQQLTDARKEEKARSWLARLLIPKHKKEYVFTKTTPMIRVKHPDGRIGTIPESQWEDAKKEGFVKI